MSEAENSVITWVQVLGFYFVVLGRRILDGKPGVLRVASHVAGGMAMSFVDGLFPPLKAGPSFLYFFHVPYRLRDLAVQRCVSGF